MPVSRPKGSPKTPGSGRSKGTPNKTTGLLKEMILQALAEQEGGGVEYLKQQAQLNPGAFMTLLGKVLPTQIQGDPENPVHLAVKTIELVALGKRTDSNT